MSRRDELSECGIPKRDSGEYGEIVRAGVVSWRVQAVGILEVGVGKPQLLCALIHERDKRWHGTSDAISNSHCRIISRR